MSATSGEASLEVTWDQIFEHVKFHKENHPKDVVPYKYIEWLYEQRQLLREGKLEHDHREKLEGLGLPWNGGPIDEAVWENRFEELMAYQRLQQQRFTAASEEEEEIMVHPQEEERLAKWFDNQLELFRKGGLSSEHRQKFYLSGFNLANFPPIKTHDNVRLVANLRQASTDALQQDIEERTMQVKPIGRKRESSWPPTNAAKKPPLFSPVTKRTRNGRSWEDSFALLEKFKLEHGHCNVTHTYEDASLYEWVRKQRKARDTMAEERRQELDRLGLVWNLSAKKWEESFQALVELAKLVEGLSVSPEQFYATYLVGKDTKALGMFFNYQRELVNIGGRLPEEQERKFKAFLLKLQNGMKIATSDSPNDDNNKNGKPQKRRRVESNGTAEEKGPPLTRRGWNQSYAALCAFKQKYGHCNVSKENTDDLLLGNWVKRQRKFRMKMTDARVQLLDQLGFEWEPTTTTRAPNSQEVEDFGGDELKGQHEFA